MSLFYVDADDYPGVKRAATEEQSTASTTFPNKSESRPLHWWADVRVGQANELFVKPGVSVSGTEDQEAAGQRSSLDVSFLA